MRNRIICMAATVLFLYAASGCGQTITPAAPIRAEADSDDSLQKYVSNEQYDDGYYENDSAVLAINSEPNDVLVRFQEANNDRDLQALMDCYDPEYLTFSQALGEGLGSAISSAFFGVSVKTDTSQMMPFFSKVYQKYVQNDDVYAKLELIETATEYIDSDNATIYYTERVVAQDGSVITENAAEMPVTRVDGTWYISMSDILASALLELMQ